MDSAEEMVEANSRELTSVVNMVEMDAPGDFYHEELSLRENYDRLAMNYRMGEQANCDNFCGPQIIHEINEKKYEDTTQVNNITKQLGRKKKLWQPDEFKFKTGPLKNI